MKQESQPGEYHESMVAFLEWIWGRDFMAPGGEGNVDKLVRGIDLSGKRVLDIGCGIGGPAFVLVRKYGARVTGIDLEPQLIERATRRAVELGISGRAMFHTVTLGPLDFPDSSFDVVFTSGALTQTGDKTGIVAECYRVLKPGGVLTCYDWLKGEGEISEDMRYFIRMEGLTYNLITLAELGRHLVAGGFEDVTMEDASDWYRRESRREYEWMRGEGMARAVELIGEAQAEHMIEDWRSMVVVCEKGELRQGYTRGRRPRLPGLLHGGAVAALLLCVCLAVAAEEPPADPKAPQATAEARPAADETTEFKTPPGFRRKTRGELILYCRKEDVLGSRFKAEKCYDQAGVEELLRAEHESKELMDTIRSCSVGSCPGG